MLAVDCRGCLELPNEATSKHHRKSESRERLIRIAPSLIIVTDAASANKSDESPCHPQPPMALSTPTGTTPPAATLEALPPELRRHILFSITDLGDLRALVLASPVYYQLYLLDRRALLEATLASTLGTVVAEAVAVLESTESCGPSGEIISVEVMPFVNYYVRLRSQPPSTILNALSEQHLVTMARFYLTVAQPLVLKCAALFLWNLDISLEGFPLSDTERTRLLRALYRFELYCRVFGAGPRGHERLPTIAFRQQIILLFDSWKAWEIEEAWCIYALIGAKYEELFETIQLDADPDHDQPEELSGLDDPGG